MKISKIATACALACASMASQAAPLAGAFDTPDLTIYLTGASAPQNFLGALAGGLFNGTQGSAWFAYADNGSTVGANYRAYFGEVKTDASIPAALQGKKVLIINRAKGGSVFGVNPVATGQGIATMPVTAANCPGGATGSFNFTCNEVGNDLAANANNQIPDMGVSDVEPSMFKGPYNVEFGQTQLSAADLSVISASVKSTAGVMFGVAATNAVTAKIANISSANTTALVGGTIVDWNAVDVGFPVGTNVAICRRQLGSGTQAAYNAQFNKFPCSTGNISGSAATVPAGMQDSAGYDGAHAGTAGDPILIDPTAGFTVVENSASGQVRSCLIAAQNGTDHVFTGADGKTYKVQFSLVGGPTAAIGVLSLDSKGNTGYSTQWTYLNLDGSAPSQDNMTENSYGFMYEQTMQYRTKPSANGTPALSGLKKTFADFFMTRAADPAVLATIANVNVKDSVASIPPTFTPTLAATGVVTNKVMKGSRLGNSCSPIQKFF